ncbi:MAG: hypothetical protein ATN36_02290 [Epulopiscium sp. Nele67-Bin005]|nr:MAG: hypothetical protein ATN36_02290 [Epulopiscium sp. Nele67-Bin005]
MEPQKSSGAYQFNAKWVPFLPIICLLGAVPLITRLVVVEPNQATYDVFAQSTMYDFFSQYKASAILFLTLIILCITFFIIEKRHIKMDNRLKFTYACSAIFLVMTAVSTFSSEYSDIAMWGIFDRAEGLVAIGCYIVIFLYSIYIFSQENEYNFVIYPLIFVTLVMSIIGYYQYIGQDLLLHTDFGKQLVVPEKYAYLRNSIGATYDAGNIYATLYHYNYVGSFSAMILPFFLTLMFLVPDYKKKVLFAIVVGASGWLLLGSTARSGLIGLAAALLVFIIIFAKQLIKKWKVTLPIVVIAVAGAFGVNAMTDGQLFARIPSLVNDAVGIFLPSNNDFDYKDHIPVRAIYTYGDELIIEVQQGTLHINPMDDKFAFKDENGNAVASNLNGNEYTITDARFERLSFDYIPVDIDAIVSGQPNEEQLRLAYQNIKGDILVKVDRIGHFGVRINSVTGPYTVDGRTLAPMLIEEAPSIGFVGKEQLGSARGYIWSRSLPMAMDTIFVGNGPDTYAIEFPQNDQLAKWYAYGTTSIVVDKPHNLYLQIAINQSGIALVAFLGIVVTYIVDSLKLYFGKEIYDTRNTMGIACLVAVVGYLGAGLFNDSVVSVAPIFWILMGCGIATNFIIRKEEKIALANTPHATIDMKTRKHISEENMDKLQLEPEPVMEEEKFEDIGNMYDDLGMERPT